MLGGHKNIVEYYDSTIKPLNSDGEHEALILMEFCAGLPVFFFLPHIILLMHIIRRSSAGFNEFTTAE